jgi:hypothetical protein
MQFNLELNHLQEILKFENFMIKDYAIHAYLQYNVVDIINQLIGISNSK